MVDPLSPEAIRPIGPAPTSGLSRPRAPATVESSFTTVLRRQLEQVSQMQTEAEQGVQNLLTGRDTNLTDVFVTARKAEMAFSLLMEIRNKLVDAYTELRNLRV
jgi:flagellar hook-basal body complex protein FliE